MNLEELTFVGAQIGGAVTGILMGLKIGSLGAIVGGALVGGFFGWALCFFPFLVARLLEEKQLALAKCAQVLGFLSPLTASLTMWWLW